MRLKVAVIVGLIVLRACSNGSASLPVPQTVVDLYNPCTTATTEAISEAVGFPMLRAPSGDENASRFRSCRWVAGSENTDAASIDYLDVDPRPFVDVILRQTGIDDEAGVDVVFAEVDAATNTRPEPALRSSTETPRLADDVRRTDVALWAIKGDRMLIIVTTDAAYLDALITSVAPALLERL
jgi:hypothetical protein